jgi:hypothetical protein
MTRFLNWFSRPSQANAASSRRRPVVRPPGRRAGTAARPRVEVLEDRTVPSNFMNLANGLDAQLQTIDGGINALLDAKALVPFLNGQKGLLDAKNFIEGFRSQLQTTLSGLSDSSAVSTVQQALFNVLGPPSPSNNNKGLNVLGDRDNDGTVDPQDIYVNITGSDPSTSTITLEMRLHKDLAQVNQSLTFGLGLPALPFNVATSGGVQLHVGFDFELACSYAAATQTFTFDTSKKLNVPSDPVISGHELAVEAQAVLTNFNANLHVGFFGGTATDIGKNNDPDPTKHTALSAAFVVDNLTNTQQNPIQVAVIGRADANLMLTLGAADGNYNVNPQFPSLSTHFALDWQIDTTNANAPAPTVAFDDVTFSLGTLFSGNGAVGQVITFMQNWTKPLQPLIDVLKAPIPVLSDLSHLIKGPDITLESIATNLAQAGAFGQYDALVELAATLVDVTNDINQINAGGNNISIDVGNLTLGGGNEDLRTLPVALDISTLQNNLNTALTSWTPNSLDADDLTTVIGKLKMQLDAIAHDPNQSQLAQAAAQAAENLLPQNTASITLAFPILDDPGSCIFKLLLGQDTPLVSFTAQFGWDEQMGNIFPLPIPGLDAVFPVSAKMHMDGLFQGVYDSFGLREFIHDLLAKKVVNVGDLADGFYLTTDDVNPDHHAGTHLNLSGSLDATAAVNAVVFQAGVTGGLKGNLQLWLSDPDKDGHLRLNELQNLSCLFQASGDLEAFLQAFVKIGVDTPFGFLGYEKDFDIAGGKLIDFGTSSCTENPFNPPQVQLASLLPGGILRLNIGPNAPSRLYQTNVIDEDYTISHTDSTSSDPPGEVVLVTAFGVTQRYAGVTQIMGDGGDGNDVITIESGVLSGAQFTEGDGNDQVTYLGNGNFKLIAGNGNDVVTCGHGYNYVRTGSGQSALVGSDGSTATMAPPWAQAMTGDGTLYLNDFAASGGSTLQGGDGLNHLVAGPGLNKLIAGKRDDYLEGDNGTNTFIAGSGHDTVRLVNGTNTVVWAVGNGNLDVSNAGVLLATNALQVSGSDGPDVFSLAPNGQMSGLDLHANAALIHWVGFINKVSIDGAGGSDTTNIADMESSSVTDIGLNDGEASQPDGSADVVNVQGSPNNHTILAKTESAFLHPEGPIGGVMLVQTHPHYQIHVAVTNNQDTLNVFAKGSNNTINVQSNTGHTVIYGDAGGDTYNVSSDAPTDNGVLLETPQPNRPPFGLFGVLDLHAGPGSNSLTVSESGSTQSDHVIVTGGSISGGPLQSFDPVTKQPVTMTWQVNYDTPANGSFAGGILLKTGTAADDIRVQSTPANVAVTVRSGGGGDRVLVGSPNRTLDTIGGTVTVDGGGGKAVLTFDDKNASGSQNYLVSFSLIVGNFLVRGSKSFVYRNVGTMILNSSDHGNSISVNAVGDATTQINAGGGNDTITVGDVNNQLAVSRPLTIDGQGGTDQLTLHDEGPRLTAVSYQVSDTTISGSNFQPISYSNIAILTLHTATSASGTNPVRVLGTNKGAITILGLGGSNHAVTVGDAANTLDSLNGPLAVHGQSGAQNELTVFDTGTAAPHTYVLDNGLVSRIGAANIAYDHMTSVVLGAGQKKSNTIAVRGTSPGVLLTTVNTGNAGDTVQLGDAAHTLNGFLSPLSVQGGAANNTLAGPDQAIAWKLIGPDTGTLANNLVSFSHMHDLLGGSQADVFQLFIGGSLSGAINGGGGSNMLDYAGFAGNITVNLTLGTATSVGSVMNVPNVKGSLGNSLIVGGSVAGNLIGGGGRSLIVGHTAGSALYAGSGDSILIGGRTSYDTNPAALNELMLEWTSIHTLSQRVGFLTNGGGLNGSFVLNTSTVHKNGTYSLFGSLNPAETNWFFFEAIADVKQSKPTDLFTMIS